jgi:hypothetical protein
VDQTPHRRASHGANPKRLPSCEQRIIRSIIMEPEIYERSAPIGKMCSTSISKLTRMVSIFLGVVHSSTTNFEPAERAETGHASPS